MFWTLDAVAPPPLRFRLDVAPDRAFESPDAAGAPCAFET